MTRRLSLLSKNTNHTVRLEQLRRSKQQFSHLTHVSTCPAVNVLENWACDVIVLQRRCDALEQGTLRIDFLYGICLSSSCHLWMSDK